MLKKRKSILRKFPPFNYKELDSEEVNLTIYGRSLGSPDLDVTDDSLIINVNINDIVYVVPTYDDASNNILIKAFVNDEVGKTLWSFDQNDDKLQVVNKWVKPSLFN